MDQRRGFTMVELIIVLVVGTILTTMAMRAISDYQMSTSVSQARQVFLSMHARARAQAIELGQDVELKIDTANDSVYVASGGVTLTGVGVRTQFGVDIQGSGTHTVCMNSRGFADTSCNSFSTTLSLVFAQGSEADTVQVLPLGQVLY